MSEPEYNTPDGLPLSSREWTPEEKLRHKAVRNLRRRAEFKVHLVTYLLVNLLLIAIWASVGVASGTWFPWWIFPLFGWGIGVGIHGWTTYHDDELSEARIRAEMERLAGHEL